MAEPIKTNKDRLKDITDGIEQGIKDLFQSDRYSQYLRTMSRFSKYSVNNQMLIYMQKPDATLVAGYNKWRDQFERHVVKGEKGIQIIAPTPFKKMMEMQKLDPDTGAPVLDANGKVVTEEKEVQIPMFKPVTVFDVSQTDGKPLPSLAADLTGNVQRYDFFMEALHRISPVPMGFEAMQSSTDGYFSQDDQRIAIRKGMSEVQTVVATVHEITHAKLHNREQERLSAPIKEGAEPPKPKDRSTEEVEAESVAYAVCQYYGIETGENSFGYIATWSKDKELPELRASLETINKTASGLISDIDFNYREVVKEYDVVIESWAADYADYIYEDSGDSLIISTRDELIAEAVDDIKNGDSRFPRTALLDIEMRAANPATALYHRLDEIEKSYPPVEHDAMYLLDDEIYLHLQTAIDGYDYTTYDKSLREIDGGVIDYPHISFEQAYAVALELERLQPESVEKVSLDILDEIAAVRQSDIEDYLRNERGSRLMPEQDAAMTEILASPRTYDLIASYEDLFVDRQADKKVRWAGDLHLHIPKDGVPKETQYEAYLVALDALDISHDSFMENNRYSERGNIIVDLCRSAQMDIPEHIFSQLPQSERIGIMDALSEVERWEADHIVDFTVTEQTVTPSKMTPPYDVMDFTDAQWNEIKLGWEQNIDVSQYAQPDIPAESMAKMRDALARGLIIQTVEEAPTHDAVMPETPEQAHGYPMPDPDYSVKDLEDCGYMEGDMLPLSQYRALELYSKDLSIYMIDSNGAASMVFNSEEIAEHSGLFAVPYEEWEIARAELSTEKEAATEQDFFDAPHDTYAIYQVKDGKDYRDYRFISLDSLQSTGLDAQRDNYNFIYTAPLTDTGNTSQKLESLYHQFNVNHPADYRGHSLSVSDIIALKQDGAVTYHYCDSAGFQQLPGFNAANNPLRSLEDSIEQNDNNLDGIINNLPTPTVAELEAQVKAGQTISLMDLARAVKEEGSDKKPSVMEKLKQQPSQEHKKTAPKKSAEMEL